VLLARDVAAVVLKPVEVAAVRRGDVQANTLPGLGDALAPDLALM
jgi:hypothetical protein